MMAKLVYGVSDGTFITAVHPVAMTGATFRAIIAAGKFQLDSHQSPVSRMEQESDTTVSGIRSWTHGTSNEQTPIGCLITMFLVPFTELGKTCP